MKHTSDSIFLYFPHFFTLVQEVLFLLFPQTKQVSREAARMSRKVVASRLIAFGKKRELTCGPPVSFFPPTKLACEAGVIGEGAEKVRDERGTPKAHLSSLSFFGTRKICPWPKRGKLTSALFPRTKHTDIQTNERTKTCQLP